MWKQKQIICELCCIPTKFEWANENKYYIFKSIITQKCFTEKWYYKFWMKCKKPTPLKIKHDYSVCDFIFYLCFCVISSVNYLSLFFFYVSIIKKTLHETYKTFERDYTVFSTVFNSPKCLIVHITKLF